MASKASLRRALRVVRAASTLVPGDWRTEWREEWEGELVAWDASGRPGAVRHACGAFADAFWIRQRRVADLAWVNDLRHGWRQMSGHRAFAATAVTVLALGMAASVTAFSVVSQVLLRPLPYPDPDRVVTLWERQRATEGRLEVAPGNFLEWRARAASFVALAGAEPYSHDYTDGDRPEVWRAAKVTPGFFESFGIAPQRGRWFAADEYAKGRDRVVMLSARIWRSRFASDPSVIGRRVTLDAEPWEVVGVMPDDFVSHLLEDRPGDIGVWVPKYVEEHESRVRASGYWQVVGRLADGVTIEQARADLGRIAAQLEGEYPRTNRGSGVEILTMREFLVGDVRPALGLFTLAVVVVLLIACVNVTNLLLARGTARRHEMAVRSALGASRWRLVGQLLVESLLLSGLAAAAALVVAHGAMRMLARLGPRELPWLETLHVDATAMAFAVALALVVAVVAGLVPALRLAAGAVPSSARTATADRAQRQLRSALVGAEVALALVLVSGAALLLRSFVSLVAVDTGFRADGVAVLQVFAWDRNPGPDRLRTFFDSALEAVQALPGVQAVGAVSAMPFIEANIDMQSTLRLVGEPEPAPGEEPRGSIAIATPGYFDVMGARVIRGRGLEAGDGAGRPRVAVISEALAERYWGGRDPIGRRVGFRLQGAAIDVEVVGVVSSLRHERLDGPPRPEVIVPLAQAPFGSMTIVARTAADPRLLIESAKQAVWRVDPLQTFYRTATLDDLVARTLSARRFALVVLTGFAAVALVLAAAGLYGVLTAITLQYRREIGVRMAVGARAIDVLRLVLARGLLVVGAGIGVGAVAALGGLRVLERYLFSVTANDPLAIGGAALLMVLVAMPACLIPAGRAARTSPSDVLRTE